MRLKDLGAIVTGGARGIGLGVAQCFVNEGAHVALLDIDGEEAERAAGELGPGNLGVGADLTDESTAAEAVEKAVAALGRLDILVNNAGGGNRQTAKANGPPFTGIQQEGWDEHLAINLRTIFTCSKAAIPHLTQQAASSIVIVSSVAGLKADVGMPAYGAAKAAALSVTRSLALELGPANVRVNAICPGLLYTRAWKVLASNIQKRTPAYADKTPYEVFLEVVKRATPLGREQTPEDIGKLATFLCSDDACNITGQVISVDGGSLLKTGV
jgi:NAD(P)-dependent dehydrogenase (short-subunit alcohol dehydrogenase family)